MKTYSPKPEHIERRWYVIDASDKVLGRVASEAAALLRGKHKPIFAPHMDTGDHVIIVNADKVVLTGGKEKKKFAYRHSGYPGGITATRYDELMSTRPVFAVEKAIRGMLPKNRLGRSMIRKLHVVGGAEHPHAAQQPIDHTLGRPPAWEGLPSPKPVTELKTRHLTSGDEADAADEAAVEPAATKPAAEEAHDEEAGGQEDDGEAATRRRPREEDHREEDHREEDHGQDAGGEEDDRHHRGVSTWQQ